MEHWKMSLLLLDIEYLEDLKKKNILCSHCELHLCSDLAEIEYISSNLSNSEMQPEFQSNMTF